jgi:4-amino-4-deoxy-L-arabinose transferase-like glycosyltransferase
VGARSPERVLVVILLLAALARVSVALVMGDQITVLPGIQDQVSYDALAQSLLAGRGYSFTEKWYPFTPANTPTAHWSFAYPLYLAGIYAVTGYHPLVARLVQGIVGGALICVLLYRIGRRVANEAVGLIAAALAAGYGYFVYYNAALMTETFFIVSVLFSLYLCLELKERPTLQRWLALGLALGVAGLLRQTMLVVAPVLLLWLAWEHGRRGAHRWPVAIPMAVIVLMTIPWAIRNYLVYHQFLLLNSNAGYALYASNNPNLGTDWSNDEVVVPVPAELAGKNEAELSQALTQIGIGYIVADPQRYLWLTLDKTLEYFKFWPSRASSGLSNLTRVLSFGLVLPFMLGGLALSIARWRSFVLLYVFALSHTVIHLLSWPAPRYRLPVDAVFMVFAGLAVYEAAIRFRPWMVRQIPALGLAAKQEGSSSTP